MATRRSPQKWATSLSKISVDKDKQAISPPSDVKPKPLIRITEIPDPELEFDIMEDVFTNM